MKRNPIEQFCYTNLLSYLRHKPSNIFHNFYMVSVVIQQKTTYILTNYHKQHNTDIKLSKQKAFKPILKAHIRKLIVNTAK